MLTSFFVYLVVIEAIFSSSRELQFENDFVRVWKTTFLPHKPLNYCRHDAYRVLVALQGGTLKQIEEAGDISYLHLEAGKAYWHAPDLIGTLHAQVNESDQNIIVLVTELKACNDPGPGYGIEFEF